MFSKFGTWHTWNLPRYLESRIKWDVISGRTEKKKVVNKSFSAENGWLRSRSDDDGSSNLEHESLIYIPCYSLAAEQIFTLKFFTNTIYITKMEMTLFVSSKLTFSDFLWCLNFLLMEKNELKRVVSFEAISFEILHPTEAQNSNIIKNRRMSSLKRQIMVFPF